MVDEEIKKLLDSMGIKLVIGNDNGKRVSSAKKEFVIPKFINTSEDLVVPSSERPFILIKDLGGRPVCVITNEMNIYAPKNADNELIIVALLSILEEIMNENDDVMSRVNEAIYLSSIVPFFIKNKDFLADYNILFEGEYQQDKNVLMKLKPLVNSLERAKERARTISPHSENSSAMFDGIVSVSLSHKWVTKKIGNKWFVCYNGRINADKIKKNGVIYKIPEKYIGKIYAENVCVEVSSTISYVKVRKAVHPNINGDGVVCLGDLTDAPFTQVDSVIELLKIANLDSPYGNDGQAIANMIYAEIKNQRPEDNDDTIVL